MSTKNLERKFFIMAGSSGVGKKTIIREVLGRRDDLVLVKSYTSRAVKDINEKESNFFSISRKEFEKRIAQNQMLEYDIVHGDYMGLGKDIVDEALESSKSLIKDVTTSGYLCCKEKLEKELSVVGIWLTAKKSDLKARLQMRGEENIASRLKTYAKEQKDMVLFDFAIDNYNKDKTVYTVEEIIDFEHQGKNAIPLMDPSKFNIKKIEKFVRKIDRNRTLKPVKVVICNGEMFVVEGTYRYLAGLIRGVNVCKFVEEKEVNVPDLSKHCKEWGRIIKNLTK